MEKKKVAVLAAGIAAGLILIVTFILTIVTMVNVKALQATLETINISYGADHVVYEGGDEEPSILADGGLELAGEDTISLKDKTIGCKASVTPAEFKKGTKVKLKVLNDGNVYPLKRNENAFEGSIRLPLFEDAGVQVILEEGETVRSEYLDSKKAYVTTDFAWSAAGSPPRMQKGSALFEWDIEDMLYGDEVEVTFPQIQIVGLADGKQVYKKTVEGEFIAGNEDKGVDSRWIYSWEGKVPLENDKKVELYVSAAAKAGLTYRYKIGQVQRGMTEGFWSEDENRNLEILSPDGTVLSKVDPYAEEEEDEI